MLDEKIQGMQQEIIEKISECIKIKSVMGEPKDNMPFGIGPYAALKYALDLSKTLGFRTVNLDNMIGYAEYGTGDEMIAVLGHLDVVPEGSGWLYPPYGGEIHDGKIFGRGIIDDKGPTIGALYALKAIKDLDLPLSKRIRVIFGTNEESGSQCAKHYAVKEEMPVAGFTPDACYPIINGEKGIVNITCCKAISNKEGLKLLKITGGTAPNSVPAYVEAVLEVSDINKEKIKNIIKDHGKLELIEGKQLVIKAKGVTAHGSTPELGINAISLLVEFLAKLDFEEGLKKFFNFLYNHIGYETDGKSLGIFLQDDVSGKLTVNLGTIDGDENNIRFKLNIRYPVTKNYEDFNYKLMDTLKMAGIDVEEIVHKKSLYIEPSTKFIKKLQKVYKDKTGKEPCLISYGGGTYAKSLKNIVAFGPIFEGEPDLDHQPNECMSIDSLIKNVQIIAAAMVELAK